MRDTDKDWEYFGRRDPYFGVVSWEKFRRDKLDEAGLEEFFATGEEYIEGVFQTVSRHFPSEFRPSTALDFGCGTGRLLIPLSQRVESVTGLDVSSSMLEEARRNLDAHGCTNVRLVNTIDELERSNARFDFINSFIVFQHIEPRRGYEILDRLLRLLNPGGLGALHFTITERRRASFQDFRFWLFRRIPILFSFRNLLKGVPFREPPMLMNEYSPRDIFAALHTAGCTEVLTQFSFHGQLGAVFYFRKP